MTRRTVGSKEGRWVELSKSQTVLAVSVRAASSGTVTIAVVFAFVGSKDIQSLIVVVIEADTVDFIASAGIRQEIMVWAFNAVSWKRSLARKTVGIGIADGRNDVAETVMEFFGRRTAQTVIAVWAITGLAGGIARLAGAFILTIQVETVFAGQALVGVGAVAGGARIIARRTVAAVKLIGELLSQITTFMAKAVR